MERLLLTVPEAGEVLRVGRTAVYRLLADGELRAVHIGKSIRIPTTAVAEYVDRLTDRGVREDTEPAEAMV